MSFSNLIPDVISHILSFLTIRDHSRFSRTCKAYYEAFGITRIRREGEAEVIEGAGAAEGGYENLANRYTVFLGDGSDDGVLGRIVGLDVKKYTGTTRHVKHLEIRGFCQYIHGNTIQYVPRCLTGEGLRYLVKLTINNNNGNGKCIISNVRFERLVALRADRCSIIGCQFDELESLELRDTQFLSEMPVTIKTLHVHWCQFSDDCVKRDLVNLVNINSTGHDFIRYAPNVKEAVLNCVWLYNLPESLEYLKLVNVRVQGEKIYLPNLRYLRIDRFPVDYIDGMFPHIIAPRLSELTARNIEISALDCPPVLDVCNTFNMKRNIDINSVVLFTDHAIDPKKFPSMRALYFHVPPGDLGDFVYELDMVSIHYVTAKTSMNINTRVLVTSEIFKDADLSKMSRLEMIIAPAEYATMVPASVEFIKYDYEQHGGELRFIKLFKELFPDPPLNNFRVF